MPRNSRQHLPGHAFHITAKTQGGAHWFTDDIRSTIQRIIVEGVASSDARLYTHAVMSNHVHLLVVQGTAPLGWTMQPILRRIALRVQKRHDLKGHVFGGPYYGQPCRDVEHLQNTVLYIHHNPVDAGCCADPHDYEWSSARAWADKAPCGHIAVEDGLRAFTCSPTGKIEELRAIYLDALMGRRRPAEFDVPERGARTRLYLTAARFVRSQPLRDLHDVARSVLRVIGDHPDLDVIRSRYGGPAAAAVRRELIATFTQRGYTGVAIAKYLRISTTCVSKVRNEMRRAALEKGRTDSAA